MKKATMKNAKKMTAMLLCATFLCACAGAGPQQEGAASSAAQSTVVQQETAGYLLAAGAGTEVQAARKEALGKGVLQFAPSAQDSFVGASAGNLVNTEYVCDSLSADALYRYTNLDRILGQTYRIRDVSYDRLTLVSDWLEDAARLDWCTQIDVATDYYLEPEAEQAVPGAAVQETDEATGVQYSRTLMQKTDSGALVYEKQWSDPRDWPQAGSGVAEITAYELLAPLAKGSIRVTIFRTWASEEDGWHCDDPFADKTVRSEFEKIVQDLLQNHVEQFPEPSLETRALLTAGTLQYTAGGQTLAVPLVRLTESYGWEGRQRFVSLLEGGYVQCELCWPAEDDAALEEQKAYYDAHANAPDKAVSAWLGVPAVRAESSTREQGTYVVRVGDKTGCLSLRRPTADEIWGTCQRGAPPVNFPAREIETIYAGANEFCKRPERIVGFSQDVEGVGLEVSGLSDVAGYACVGDPDYLSIAVMNEFYSEDWATDTNCAVGYSALMWDDYLSHKSIGESFVFYELPHRLVNRDSTGALLYTEQGEGGNPQYLYLATYQGDGAISIGLFNFKSDETAWEFASALFHHVRVVRIRKTPGWSQEKEDAHEALLAQGSYTPPTATQLSFAKGSCIFAGAGYEAQGDSAVLKGADGTQYRFIRQESADAVVLRQSFYERYEQQRGDAEMEALLPCEVLREEDGSYLVQDALAQYRLEVARSAQA